MNNVLKNGFQFAFVPVTPHHFLIVMFDSQRKKNTKKNDILLFGYH